MKYYGQFKPSVDEIIHKRYFKNIRHGISIEAGALDGVWDSSTYFFKKNYEWNTINIEPLNNMFKKLIINRPNSINLNLALSNKNGISLWLASDNLRKGAALNAIQIAEEIISNNYF